MYYLKCLHNEVKQKTLTKFYSSWRRGSSIYSLHTK